MAVSDATQAELDLLKVADTVEGQCALALGRQIDGKHNSLATSTDVKQLLATMETLRERADKVKADSVDDSRGETDRILRSVG